MAAVACAGGRDTTPAPVSQMPTGVQPTELPSSPASGDSLIDLAEGGARTTVYGADNGDFFNDLPLLTTGDVNGDGLADVLMGARFGDGQDNSREDSGEAYLLMGRNAWPETIDLAADGADLVIYGANPNDQLGFAGALSDVNGDGLDDIMLGAPFALRGDSQTQTGAAYAIFGRKELPRVIDLSRRSADVTLLGTDASSLFGDSVASTDASGDGVADVIIGATFGRRPEDLPRAGAAAGAAYVVLGGPQLSGVYDMANEDYDLAVYGDNDQPHPDELGDTVAGGDINGDGFGDVIITAEAADGPENDRSVAAEVHVVFGRPDLRGVVDVGAGEDDLVVWGAAQNDTAGFNIGAADVTGDGVADLLVTSRGGDGPDDRIAEAGEVHIIRGGKNLPATIDLADAESSACIYGRDPADMLAYGLATVDLDGDGIRELFIGTGFGDGPAEDRLEAGEAFVIDARFLVGASEPLEAPVRLAIYGAQPDDHLGAAVTAGDLDGDGKPELVLLAQRADGPDGSRQDAGQFYIVKA